MAAATATVLREGERRSIPATEVVPGDIIVVEEGALIAADARLIESVSLQTAEAALTGESKPAHKDPAPLPPGTALALGVDPGEPGLVQGAPRDPHARTPAASGRASGRGSRVSASRWRPVRCSCSTPA
jgi:magnesium-transporting ATPase (P-type)